MMDCHDHAATLVDIARGSPADREIERAAHAHANACEACAALLRGERELTATLRELRLETPAPAGEAMEQRLLRALAEQCELEQRRGTHETHVRIRQTPLWQWASAAALLLSASAAWYVLAPRHRAAPSSATETVRHAAEPASVPDRVVRPVPPAPVITPSAPPRRRPRQPDLPVDDGPLFADFVALPEASALPVFESGRIVRIEIPVTMLPAYGLHMVPQAAPADVEADLLVGQDGLPRAIRLASSISNDQE